MWSEVFTHVNSLQPSFHWRVKTSIMATSSLTLRNLPRWMPWRVRIPNQVTTQFTHEAKGTDSKW